MIRYVIRLIILIMSLSKIKITVNLPRTPTHVLKNAKCNGSSYVVPFPSSTYNFIEISQSLQISKAHEKTLAILSKSTKELESIEQFYNIQSQCLHYFNICIELDTSVLAFSVISESEKVLQQLDKLKFSDFLTVLKHGYDSLSIKLHSKLNRRIKKYLADSKRSQSQKQQVQQLINFMKQSSSQEEEELQPIVKGSKAQLKKKVQKKHVEKVVEDNQPQEAQVKKGSFQKLLSQEKKNQVSQQKKTARAKKETKVEKQKYQNHNQRNNQRQNKNKEENKEEDWEDVKEEKTNKRFEKNNQKKHFKYDKQPINVDIEDDAQEQNKPEEKIKPAFKERKPKNRDKDRSQVDGRKLFGSSKQKPQRDMRVLLGINGDTDDGWRQRYRVSSILPQLENKAPFNKSQKNRSKDNNDNSQTKEKLTTGNLQKQESKQNKVTYGEKPQKQESTKIESTQTKKAEVIKVQPKQKSLSKLFTYPADGKSFTLNTNQNYNLLVNKIFWVKVQANQVIIQKVGAEANGFIRNCKFKSTEDYLLQAEDLTLSLNGMSNLQDGGTKFGNPVIRDFTENESQWFKIRDLEIFGYV